jgi:hypothetical protein
MQPIEIEPREPLGRDAPRTFAEPLCGLCVSWGAVFCGTVALLAVALILWALALAIVSLAAHPTAASLRGSAIALWICAMIATVVGSFVGGGIAGYLPGSPRRNVALTHGFLAWGLALIVSLAFQLLLLRGAVAATVSALADAVAAQSMEPEPSLPMAPSRADLIDAGKVALDYVRGAGWSWFGTWLVAGVLALAGAYFAARRLGAPRATKGLGPTAREEREDLPLGPPKPLTPAPTL